MSPLFTPAEVIEELGGPTAVARLLGARHSSMVSNWIVRKRLPGRTYPVLIQALAIRGKYASPKLWGMMEIPSASK